jgi:hypothetical protein
VPAKPKEEKKESKNKKNNTVKTNTKKQPDNGSVADKAKPGDNANADEKKEKRQTPPKEEKPKVKRSPPKSKWGNIMSQIEASKDTVKVKPKAEIKSSLSQYLHAPASASTANLSASITVLNVKNQENVVKKADTSSAVPSKPKHKLVTHKKPDFSNVRSKLFADVPSKPRERSASPSGDNPGHAGSNPGHGGNPGHSNPGHGGNAGHSNPGRRGSNPGHGQASAKSTTVKKATSRQLASLVADHQLTVDNCSNASVGTASVTDLSTVDGNDFAGSTSALSLTDTAEKRK